MAAVVYPEDLSPKLIMALQHLPEVFVASVKWQIGDRGVWLQHMTALWEEFSGLIKREEEDLKAVLEYQDFFNAHIPFLVLPGRPVDT